MKTPNMKTPNYPRIGFATLGITMALLSEVLGQSAAVEQLNRKNEPVAADNTTVKDSAMKIINNPLNHDFGSALNDPHGVVHDGKVYLFAGNDFSPDNPTFVMKDWWVWSSKNLLDWQLESVLDPKDTYLKRPFTDCWAPFGAFRHGKCYFYFSAGGAQGGVVVADSVKGPWRDPLGKPLISKGYDADLLKDDDGEYYMVYGVWNYHIARMNEDMISFAEEPRLITINNPRGPYNLDGNNTERPTDDKPSLHKRNGIYYLSWSSFYAVSNSVYGPYEYRGTVIKPELLAPEYRKGNVWIDRHGNFFEFNNQWYYVVNDASQPGYKGVYRASVMTYLHYLDNGDMAPVRIDSLGVGHYDADGGRIEAENYFKAVRAEKRECPVGGFEMRSLTSGSELYYPNIHNIPANATLHVSLACGSAVDGAIEVRDGNPQGRLLGVLPVSNTGGWDTFQTATRTLDNEAGTSSLCFVVKTERDQEVVRLDGFSLTK